MPDPEDEKPLIDPTKFYERDGIRYRIGEYFDEFAVMEVFLAMTLANILNMEHSRVQFMWKDSFTDHKVKTVRRAGLQRFGPDHPKWLELKKILNEIAGKAIEFRNQLAHGLIIREAGEHKHGRPGQHSDLLYQEFEKLDQETIHQESQRLRKISMQLLDLFSDPVKLGE
jgi:hypothetical protein